ncbi:hypothetical protein IKE72_01820 [Candidatus Saccharibacteria bacterium]|nr:hypothetical protein [Candidatus Saccharibacteria bacterium]
MNPQNPQKPKLDLKNLSFNIDFKKIKAKLTALTGKGNEIREINLVPDIKYEMIKTLKLRNFIFFLCIVVSIAGISTAAVFGSIMGGQQIALEGKKGTIKNLSDKIDSFGDLGEYLTIRNQISNINTLADNKKVFSRTFDILSALIPTGPDTITISSLDVNLANATPTLTFEAHADAGTDPFIDYNVLDSFKKSMAYMRYDYGRYVDREGNEIPAYCITENGTDGAILNDPEKGIYAYWDITAEGCNTTTTEPTESTDNSSSNRIIISPTNNSNNSNDNNSNEDDADSNEGGDDSENSIPEDQLAPVSGYETEMYEGHKYVRIWRTPQFSEWYKENPKEGEPYMTLDGEIGNVAHFASNCITYTGTLPDTTYSVEGQSSSESVTVKSTTPTWTSTNNECKLISTEESADGIIIEESSNGRNENGQLVLRFAAVIYITPEAYSFTYPHLISIAPSGHHNVTDSYVQIQNMFGERATDCAADDTACRSNTVNSTRSTNDTSTNNSNSSNSSNNSNNSSNNSTNNSNSSNNSNNSSNTNNNTGGRTNG